MSLRDKLMSDLDAKVCAHWGAVPSDLRISCHDFYGEIAQSDGSFASSHEGDLLRVYFATKNNDEKPFKHSKWMTAKDLLEHIKSEDT